MLNYVFGMFLVELCIRSPLRFFDLRRIEREPRKPFNRKVCKEESANDAKEDRNPPLRIPLILRELCGERLLRLPRGIHWAEAKVPGGGV